MTAKEQFVTVGSATINKDHVVFCHYHAKKAVGAVYDGPWIELQGVWGVAWCLFEAEGIDIRAIFRALTGKEPEPTPSESLVAALRSAMVKMNADEVLSLIEKVTDGYCRECGGDAPCCCWNDE